MKKLLFSSLLGMASLCMWAAPSQAWTFGLIPCHCRPCGGRCGRCCSTICIKPYNAFSPVASGSMCFDGCAPFCNACPGGYPGMYPGGACAGYNPGMNNYQGAPACNGCPTDATPCPQPGPGAQAMPYGGPIPPAYGYAPAYPQSVMPAAAAQYYGPAGYGR
jgi:hypothetical protein